MALPTKADQVVAYIVPESSARFNVMHMQRDTAAHAAFLAIPDRPNTIYQFFIYDSRMLRDHLRDPCF